MGKFLQRRFAGTKSGSGTDRTPHRSGSRGKASGLPIVAALLTIAGYSVNDTVVVSDRIRENMRKLRRDPLEKIINQSINETLSRTIITTGTSLIVLTALLALGGSVIRPFAFALMVGFISGVYSTIFIATPVILLSENAKGRRR